MKQKKAQNKFVLSRIYLISVLFLHLFFLSCNDEINETTTNNQQVRMNKISFEEIKQSKNRDIIDAIGKIKNRTTTSRIIYDSINDFYFDDENGIKLETSDKESYTFKVYRTVEDSKLENIVFNKNLTTNEIETFLVKYNYTAKQIEDNPELALETYSNTVTNIESRATACVSTIVLCYNDGSGGFASEPHVAGPACFRAGNLHMLQTSYVNSDCGDGNSAGNSGTTGSGSNPITTPNGGSATAPSNPCGKLKDLFNASKGNIKPTILNDLRPNIAVNPSGEKAVSLAMSSSGVPTNTVIPPTSTNTVGIPTCSNYYSGIHTHPLDTYPMFSWSDVVVLNSLNNCSATHNQGMASFLLVCQDDNGVFQTYAIVFDPNSLNNTIDQFMSNPENIGCTSQEIENKMDEALGIEYANDSNYERAFLKFMSSSNVSLYKANSTLTNWSKLSLSNNSATATVNSTNCN